MHTIHQQNAFSASRDDNVETGTEENDSLSMKLKPDLINYLKNQKYLKTMLKREKAEIKNQVLLFE